MISFEPSPLPSVFLRSFAAKKSEIKQREKVSKADFIKRKEENYSNQH